MSYLHADKFSSKNIIGNWEFRLSNFLNILNHSHQIIISVS